MLVRTRPVSHRLRPFDSTFDRSFDELVDSFFRASRVRSAAPAVRSTWEEGSLALTVDLPGIPQEAVDVSVSGRTLTLSVETDNLSWQRALTLGSDLDPEQVSAHYADGRLTVRVAPVPAAEPRRIEIQTRTPAIEAGATDQAEPGEADTSATS